MTCLPPAAFFSCNVSFCRPSLLSCLSPFILFLVCFTLCLFPAFPLPAVSLAHYSLWCTLQCNFPSISVSLLTCLPLLLRLSPALSLSDVSLLPCPPISLSLSWPHSPQKNNDSTQNMCVWGGGSQQGGGDPRNALKITSPPPPPLPPPPPPATQSPPSTPHMCLWVGVQWFSQSNETYQQRITFTFTINLLHLFSP
jgi:hypothetical protein